MVLGIANSRLKDVSDLWMLARRFDFAGLLLTRALAATFARRQTIVPAAPPLALTSAFGADASKRTQWRAFIQRGRLLDDPPDLGEVIATLAGFLMSPARALAAGEPFDQHWPAGGPWRPAHDGSTA